MVFPTTRLPVKVELKLPGAPGASSSGWVDVTAYTLRRDGIRITRGRRDEGGSLEPSECALGLNNRSGRFSSRNPTGPYFGLLTRNTPLRTSVAVGSVRLLCPQYEYAYAPDTAGLSITGDIDLRFDGYLPTWAENVTNNLINKCLTAGQRSYRMGVFSGGLIFIDWSADGTNELFLSSTIPLPQTTGRQAVRATLDVDNGSGGRTARFYYAPTMAGPWSQLGAPAITAGTTSIFDGTDQVRIDPPSNSGNGGTCYSAEIRNGIGGALVGNPIFSAQADGATSFADAQGNTWSVGAGALITNRRYRFHGEVPSWPQAWDISQEDVHTTINAAGVLRRLGQGAAPLQGPIQRYTLSDLANTRAYWPLEDSQDATSMASGLPGGPSMGIAGAPRLAASDVFAASNPLPEMGNGAFNGPITAYTATGVINARCLMYVPATGDGDGAVIMRLFTTNLRWDLSYAAAGGGGLNLNAYDVTGAAVLTTGAGFAVNGKQLVVVLELVQSGANINWSITTVGLTTGIGSVWSGTLNTQTVGSAYYIQVNPNGLFADTVIGHLTVRSAGASNVDQALRGYSGETAGRRIQRLCSEEGIQFTDFGNLDDTAAMGAQTAKSLLDLLAECEAADMGQLFESRDNLGLAYRPRTSKYIQPVGLALDYTNLSSLEPVEDDQRTRNDVTVARTRGSSARATVDSGPLSTQAPPAGVGRYDDEVEVNLADDSELADQACWRVQAGTVDEPRYPVVHAELAAAGFARSQALTDSALNAEHGDLLTVANPPIWVPADRIDQHIIGSTEVLGVRQYSIDYVCEPITPAGNVGIYDGLIARYASGGASTLGGSLTTTAGTGTVATASGPLWTTSAGDMPFDIVVAGEQIRVTAVSGASSPQTFTWTRSINGVVKTHAAGESVEIYRPARWAL